jgi:two-component system, OmpR family, response regulator
LAHILLVEDDIDVRMLLEHVLLSAGHQVTVADTIASARANFEARAYDLVLADGMLPDGTGIEIARAAHERGVVALIITGRAMDLPRDELLKYDFLLKPIRPGELLSAIEERLPS